MQQHRHSLYYTHERKQLMNKDENFTTVACVYIFILFYLHKLQNSSTQLARTKTVGNG
jgi:hypothetical protein